jgi:PPM family protein phosphatase
LSQVVLQQPGLGKSGPDTEFVFPAEGSVPEDSLQKGRNLSTPPAFQGGPRACESRGNLRNWHDRSIRSIHTKGRLIIGGRMPLAAYGVTHQGRRSTNEDAWHIDPDLGLLVVADGMGGHNAGEVASALAVKVIREVCESSGLPLSQAVLTRAVQLANERILAAAAEQPAHSGMGTTVVAVLIIDGSAFYASVGDSRVYLWRGGHLTQLTRDDSWLAETLNGEDEQPRDIGTHPMRHVLTKVVGLRPELEATVSECPLGAGDSLLLCSDGVHSVVPHELLATMMSSQRGVADVAQSVVRSAIARGATDNVTAVVARVVQ